MTISRAKLTLMLCFSFLMLPVAVNAEEPSVQEVAVKLQAAYESITSFAADFRQITTMKLSRRERQGRGSLLIKKPGLMRWDYLEPDQQVIISDGKFISMYFAGPGQMTIMPAEEYLQSDVTYAFFAGTGNILADFEVGLAGEDFCCGTPPDLRLTPRLPHPQVDYLYVWLNEESLVGKMQIADHYGSITELAFSNIKLNMPVAMDRFEFTPPPDTEIVRQ